MKAGCQLFAFAAFICLSAPSLAATHYVDLKSASPASPYTNWLSAATNIQDAIDAAGAGDLILVSDGNYNSGSRTAIDSTPCRVVVDKPVTVRSVNGPGSTFIEGYSLPGSFPWSLDSVRCAYLTNGASLAGFTLTNGSVRATSYLNLGDPAGGVYCESNSAVSNCVIINCAAYIGGGAQGGNFFHCLITNCIAHIGAGGVYSANLDRCEVIWNTSDYFAGGLYYCNATNCNISYNLGLFGGGAYGGSVCQCTILGNYAAFNPSLGGGYGGGLNNVDAVNSIIYYNSADSGGDDIATGTFTNCCSPSLSSGSGNITNEPLIIDGFDIPGNFHLQPNSPCIDAGNNALARESTDLDGRPRVVGTRVDIGAYEYQGAATNDFLSWLRNFYLPSDISSDSADADGDGMNNWQEWRAGTDPTNASSVLKMISLGRDNGGITVSWQSVSNVIYYLQRSTNPSLPSSFSSIQSNIVGQSGITTNKDNSAAGPGPFFYRVGVQ